MHGAVRVLMPTLHPSQVEAYELARHNRFTAIRCGRRWGKTDLGKCILGMDAIRGWPVGWFAPDYKRLAEAYHEIENVLAPVRLSSSKVEGVFRTIRGGRIDFWTLEDQDAGRSRKYKRVFIDEAAFTKPAMMETWERAIAPTLLDFSGSCVVASNTRGIDAENFFYLICTDPKYRFVEFHATSFDNPHVPARMGGEGLASYIMRRQSEFDRLRADNHPLVFRQEYLAEFVDWSGDAFFALDKMLVNNMPVHPPARSEAVFATIDTAVKTGKEADGTAVVYWAVTRNLFSTGDQGANRSRYSLVILDWDCEQIEGALLEVWLPNVFATLESMAEACGCSMGSLGAFIEDKSSGMILLQQAARRGLKAFPIDSKLTSVGKDERAISVSGYVHRELIKMSERAFNKTKTYKGRTLNHLRSQVIGFRVGDKDARKREDDLLDCFDGETEVLTNHGWKLFVDLNGKETVATVNLATDEIEFQAPTAFVGREYSGDMVSIKGKRVDILVTPTHRMIVENRNGIWKGNRRPFVRLAKELTASSILKNAGTWVGRDDDVVIPAWEYSGARAVSMPAVTVSRGDLAEFVGWFVAEGSRGKYEIRGSVKRKVIISQMPGDKMENIRVAAGKLPFRHSILKGANGCVNLTITSAQLHDFLEECYAPGEGRPCYRKKIPGWILESSPRVLERFFAAMVAGDGWEQNGHRTVATTSKMLADQLQECLIKMGKASTMRVLVNLPPAEIRGVSSSRSATQYHVSEIRSKWIHLVNGRTRRSIISLDKYDGGVYCVSVQNGTLFLRRRGKTFLAGNCFTYGIAIALGNPEGF